MQRDLAEALRSTEALARKAVSLDGADADALTCLGRVLGTKGDYDGALTAIERAIALNPNLAIAHGTQGGMLIFSGQPEKGLVALEHGIRLDPRHPRAGVMLNQLVIGLYLLRDYEGAVEAARRVLRSYPDHPLVYRWLAAALGQLGRDDEARQALDRAMSLSPAAFDLYVRRRVPWHREEDHQHMLDGLRKAGWRG
jgi:adenylate cyclase